MRQLLVILISISLFVSCKKDNAVSPPVYADSIAHVPQRTFFHTKEAAFDTVNKIMEKFTPGRELLAIKSIAYTQSKNKTYAIVMYLTDKGMDNLVIMKEYIGNRVVAVESGKCEGANCECKVGITLDGTGNVKISCSCSSCSLVTQSLED